MIKQKFSLILVLVTLILSLTVMTTEVVAEDEDHLTVVWEKLFGGIVDDNSFSLLPSPDGGYLLVGRTESYGQGDSDGWIVKIDENGQHEWNKTFGGVNFDQWFDGHVASDGYILAGLTYSFAPDDPNEREAWAAKIGFDGNHDWINTYGWPRYDEFYATVPGNDGGYVFAGVSNVNNSHPNEFWILKTDTDGNHVWNNTFGRSKVYDMVATSDGYALLGFNNGAADGGDGYLVKTDNLGQMVWERTFDGINFDICENIIHTTDEGFLIGCASRTYSGYFDTFMIKTDSNGTIEWDVTIGDTYNEFPNSMLETEDGGYIISIHALSSFGDESGDNLLVKLSSSGSEEWRQVIGYDSDDEFVWDMIEVSDGIVMTGIIKSKGAGSYDMWVLKVVESTQTTTMTTSSNIDTPPPETTMEIPPFSITSIFLSLLLVTTIFRKRKTA